MNPNRFAMALLAAATQGMYYAGTSGKPPNKPRPCLHCQKIHQHNNAFCSAQCCKAHKSK